MKVLQVINALTPAGAEVVVCHLSMALRDSGIDSEIYAMERTGSWLEAECQRNGITIHYSNAKSVYSPRQIAQLIGHIRGHHYDVINVHLFPAQLWVAMAARLGGWKVALVTTEQNTTNRRRNFFFRGLDQWTYNQYQVVIPVSEAASVALEKWLPSVSRRLITIPNGVRLDAIAEAETYDLKKELGVQDDLLAISVGRCEPQKNHHCSIRALAKVSGIQLAIAGKGHLQHELRALAKSLNVADRVHFLGSRSDVVSLLKGSDIYVMSSLHEGLSVAALEAIAVGLPTITSRVPGLCDVVEDSGLTFDSDNDEQLAACMTRMKTEPGLRATLSAASQARARNFDIAKSAQAYGEVYRSLVTSPTTHEPETVTESLRILSVVTRFGAGGPPINVVQMARGLKRYGYETVIATGSCSAQDADMSYLLKDDDQVEWIPSMSRSVAMVADFVSLVHLVRLIRKYKPDIIHTHTAKAGVLGRLAGLIAGTPIIVHTFHGNVLRGYFGRFVSLCFQKIEQACAAVSDGIFVLSKQQQHEIAVDFRIGDEEKVRILPLGLPLDDFERLAPPSLEREELVVAWFGRLVAIKNIPLLIAVVELALEKIPKIRFLIAGDGSERPAIRELAGRHKDRVEFLGWQRDITPVIERADVLIQTSINEGTPTALIQGMAGARPFISTAVGGVPDMVIGEEHVDKAAHWFRNGVLVPPDAAAFVQVLEVFAQNRTQLSRMGLAARPWALAQYSEAKMLQMAHEIYREYLTAKGHRVPANLPRPVAAEVAMTSQLASLASQTGTFKEPKPEEAKREEPSLRKGSAEG